MSGADRMTLLMVALLLTLAATIYVSTIEEASSDVNNVAGTVAATPTRVHGGMSLKLSTQKPNLGPSRSSIADPKKDIFQPNGQPVQQAAEKIPVPTAVTFKPTTKAVEFVVQSPEAPVMPFKYLGKYNDQNGLLVFLSYNGKNLIVKPGDIIQEIYRVEEIKPPTLTMIYLPMQIIQTINIGEAN